MGVSQKITRTKMNTPHSWWAPVTRVSLTDLLLLPVALLLGRRKIIRAEAGDGRGDVDQVLDACGGNGRNSSMYFHV